MGHYPVMTHDELLALPISQITADNCIMFLWTTFPRLGEALPLIKEWGFRYKTVGFTWVKTNRNNDRPFFGIGYYTKSNAEICLIATKGRVIKPATNYISSLVMTPLERHSKKPDIIRNHISVLYPTLNKIELFARQKTPGWDVWGNEVESDIDLQEFIK